jgi:hypothetical protein
MVDFHSASGRNPSDATGTPRHTAGQDNELSPRQRDWASAIRRRKRASWDRHNAHTQTARPGAHFGHQSIELRIAEVDPRHVAEPLRKERHCFLGERQLTAHHSIRQSIARIVAHLIVESGPLVDENRAQPEGVHRHHDVVDDRGHGNVLPVRAKPIQVDLAIDNVHGVRDPAP